MPIIESRLNPRDESFQANVRLMESLVADLRAKVDHVAHGGGETARKKHAARGKLLPRERVSMLCDLPRVINALMQSRLKQRIYVVAPGKLVTSGDAAWGLCAGADFVNSARRLMFSLGCIQALRCHLNTCPTGITTHDQHLQNGLVVEEKYLRVANYAKNVNKEINMIAHSCGLQHARFFRREHVRIVQQPGKSMALNVLYPYPDKQEFPTEFG